MEIFSEIMKKAVEIVFLLSIPTLYKPWIEAGQLNGKFTVKKM
jgi:hypothetical protein